MYWNHGRRLPRRKPHRLIETWDVLKYYIYLLSFFIYGINRNMRCIEIEQAEKEAISRQRLIETWDVLKCETSEVLRIGVFD